MPRRRTCSAHDEHTDGTDSITWPAEVVRRGYMSLVFFLWRKLIYTTISDFILVK